MEDRCWRDAVPSVLKVIGGSRGIPMWLPIQMTEINRRMQKCHEAQRSKLSSTITNNEDNTPRPAGTPCLEGNYK